MERKRKISVIHRDEKQFLQPVTSMPAASPVLHYLLLKTANIDLIEDSLFLSCIYWKVGFLGLKPYLKPNVYTEITTI